MGQSFRLERDLSDKILRTDNFGPSYLVRDFVTGALLTIKQILDNEIIAKQAYNELVNEIRDRRKSKCKNIIQFYGFYFDPTSTYLMLEYAPAGSLREYIKRNGNCDEIEAKAFTRGIINGLMFCHNGPTITHGCITLDNLLVGCGKVIKLSDFALAAKCDSYKERKMRYDYDFMPPEVITQSKNIRHSDKADCYAIGIIILMLLNGGKHPFNPDQSRDKNTILQLMRTKQYEYPSSGHISEWCRDFIDRLLVPAPGDRANLSLAQNDPWLRSDPSAKIRLKSTNCGPYQKSDQNGELS